VFLYRVINGTVTGKCRADTRIDRTVVRHKVTGLIYVRDDDRFQGCGGNVGHIEMEAADATVTLNERKHDCLGRNLAFPIGCFAADISFVNLDNLVGTAQWASGRNAQFGHRFADPMPEEPCCFQTAVKGALKLASRNALLRRTEQIDGLKPYAH